MSSKFESEESEKQPFVDHWLRAILLGLVARKRTKASKVVGSSRSEMVSSIEEFRAQYDISDDVRVVFSENPDNLRSNMNSSYSKIFFT